MFVPELAEPRKKRRRRRKKKDGGGGGGGEGRVLQQQLPIPLASLTGIKPANAIWRWYRGRLERGADGRKAEAVLVDKEGDMLLRMGFFGTRKERAELVRAEQFEPLPLKGPKEGGEETEKNPSDEDTSSDDEEEIRVREGGEEEEEEEEQEQEETDGASRRKRRRKEEKGDANTPPVRLDPLEAHFLGFALGCLVTTDEEGKELGLGETWNAFCEGDPRFPVLYAAYHHFRSKGWVVKRGDKFGSDLLLYKHGPPFYHASYSVAVVGEDERRKMTWRELHGLNRVTESTAKELLLAGVTWPAGVAAGDLKEDAGIVKRVAVCETLVRRWVPSQERDEDDSQ